MSGLLQNCQTARPVAFKTCIQKPRLQKPLVVARASSSESSTRKGQVAAAATVLSAVTIAAAPAAQAAQEAFQLAEGEPLIVQIGWSAAAAVFSFSLALVVWGRSGM